MSGIWHSGNHLARYPGTRDACFALLCSGPQNSREHISHKSAFSCLRSLETFKIVFVWQQLFRLKHLMIAGVDNSSFYVFVGAPPGPDPHRAPGGPRESPG